MTLDANILGSQSEPLDAGDPLPPDDMGCHRSMIERVCRTEGPRLKRYFNARVPHHDAQDLVQESLAQLAAAMDGAVRRIMRPEAYVTRIATNLLRTRARAARRQGYPQFEALDADKMRGPDPVTTLEARDSLVRVQRAIDTLKPKTREIFLLHRLDGLSYQAIGERMGMTSKGVEKQIARALGHVRRQAGPF